MKRKFQTVVILKLKFFIKGDMAFQATYPALFRKQNCNRFFFNQNFQRNFNIFGNLGEFGTTAPQSRFFAEFFFNLLNFGGNSLPTLGLIGEQSFQLAFFGRQIVKFLFNLAFFKFAQRAQFHIQNCLSLIIGQRKSRHHFGFGIFFLADYTDNLIKIQIGNQITG